MAKKGVRLDVESVKPAVSIDAEFIALTSQWVAAHLVATLDPNGRNPILTDVAHAMDTLGFGFQLADGTDASDLLIAHVERLLADTEAVRDLLTADVSKLLADASACAEQLAYVVGWVDIAAAMDGLTYMVGWIDASSVGDQVRTNVAKPFADGQIASDDTGLVISKGLTDATESADSVLSGVQKAVQDSTTASDAIHTDINKPATDGAVSLDALIFGLARQDGSQVSDGISGNLQKSFVDLMTSGDSVSIERATILSDATASGESGTAYIQNYAADYVEAEYVGEKFTFS